MDIASLKRHMPSINDGRWVDRDEIPALLDVRLKVRGAGSDEARALYARKERAVDPKDRDAKGNIKPDAYMRLMLAMLAEYHLVDVAGLTVSGVLASVDDVRGLIVHPEYQPFADLVLEAVRCVDEKREATIEAISGNSHPSSSGNISTGIKPRVSAVS
jgi:hypothetical protein